MAELHAPGWIAAAVNDGLSATAALRAFRDAGGAMRDRVWYRLYEEQRATVAIVGDEVTKPLGAIPNATEIMPMTTRRATGYLQTLQIYTRESGTDIIMTRPFMFTTQELMTRGEALTRALTMMQQAADEDRYSETILGGVYTGTRLMTPGEVR